MTRRSWKSRTTRAALALALSGTVALSSVALVATAGASRNASKARVVARIHKTSKYGKILVTTRGMTLYTYASDTRAHSNCNGACLAIWPPLTVPKGIKPVAKGVRGLQGLAAVHLRQRQDPRGHLGQRGEQLLRRQAHGQGRAFDLGRLGLVVPARSRETKTAVR